MAWGPAGCTKLALQSRRCTPARRAASGMGNCLCKALRQPAQHDRHGREAAARVPDAAEGKVPVKPAGGSAVGPGDVVLEEEGDASSWRIAARVDPGPSPPTTAAGAPPSSPAAAPALLQRQPDGDAQQAQQAQQQEAGQKQQQSPPQEKTSQKQKQPQAHQHQQQQQQQQQQQAQSTPSRQEQAAPASPSSPRRSATV